MWYCEDMRNKVVISTIAILLFIGGVVFIEKFKISQETTHQDVQTTHLQQSKTEPVSQTKLSLDDWFVLTIPDSERSKIFSIQPIKSVTSTLFLKKYKDGKLLHDTYDTYDYIGSIEVSSPEKNAEPSPLFNIYRGQIIPKDMSLLAWVKAKQEENISSDIPQESLGNIQSQTRVLNSEPGTEVVFFQMSEPSSNGWYAYRNQNLVYLFSMGNSSDAIQGMKSGAWDSLFASIKQNTFSENNILINHLGPAIKEKVFSISPKEKLPSFCPECEENGVDPIEGQYWEFAVSEDKKQYAYMTYEGRLERIILNGKPLKLYTFVHHLTFSSDGKNFSYHAFDEKRNETYLVLNEREIPVYPEDEGYPHAANGVSEAYGPHGQFAYARVRREAFDQMEIYLNNQLINTVQGDLIHFWFSDDGEHLYYVVGKNLYEDKNLINDSVDYNAYSSLQYSQYVDGVRIQNGNIKIQAVDKGVYVGGKELRNYTGMDPEVYLAPFILSPTEDNLLYTVWINGGKEWISLNGNDAEETFDKIQDLKFSPDGKSITYIGRIGRTIYSVTHEVIQ